MNSQKIKNVVLATFVPHSYEYLQNQFPLIKFCTIPIARVSSGQMFSLTDDLKKKVNNLEYVLSDAIVGAQLIPHMPKIKWIQTVSAGVDGFFQNVDVSQLPKDLLLTRMTGVFGQLMSEYVVSQIIAWERSFFAFHNNQKGHKWDYIHWGYRSLPDITIGIMGLGEIGKEIARICKAFGAKIISLTRTLKSNENIDVSLIDCDIKEFLRSCDYLVSVIPSLPSTRGMLDNDILQHASQKKPVFINVGRGDLISESQIVKALEEKWISGAILDVFEKEPLPHDSKLWDIPQIAKVFRENLERYEKGEKLQGIVDFQTQY